MRDIAITLIVFGSLPFILRRPFIGILMWTWLGFMNPHRLAWGFSVTMPFAMIIAITTMVSLLISKEPKQIPWKRETILMVAFLLWMLLTTSMAFYPGVAWTQMEKVSKIFLMIVLAMVLINTRERLDQLVWVIALSIGFYGVKGGIFTITNGGIYQVRGPAGSFIEGNNEIGLALTMTIPLLYYLNQQARHWWARQGTMAAMLLTALAALGTQSRGAMLGMAGMGLFFWLKSSRKFTTTLLLAAVIPALLYLMPEQWYERMASIRTYEADDSALGRLSAWKFAFDIAMQRLVGGGFGCFRDELFMFYSESFRVHDSHSIFFGVLGHHGFPGLALFLMLILCTWLSASTMIRATRKDAGMRWLANLMAMTQVSLIGYLAAGAFLGMQYFDYFYNLVLIVVAGRVILARHVAGKAASQASVGSEASIAAVAGVKDLSYVRRNWPGPIS